jgi:hypothetical protein
MAGPQFLTPRSVSPSKPGKRFTLAEANRSLPLVRRVVRDIVRVHGEVTQVQLSLAAASASKDSTGLEMSAKDQAAAQATLERSVDQLNGYVDELRDIGCELKDFQTGLVDFTGHHDGHDVCLCWRLGEETIGFWHESQAGFAGRQPISTLKES